MYKTTRKRASEQTVNTMLHRMGYITNFELACLDFSYIVNTNQEQQYSQARNLRYAESIGKPDPISG